jgi:hypothetical protein
MATDATLDPRVQTLALYALQRWDNYPKMDPFLGSLRPSPHPRDQARALAAKHSTVYLSYLGQEKRADFLTLATEVTAQLGIALNLVDLRGQVLNTEAVYPFANCILSTVCSNQVMGWMMRS